MIVPQPRLLFWYAVTVLPLSVLGVVWTEAWLAAECFVMPGVSIGDGAVIGARSVVTKDMAAWTVCAGHPCVPIKPRPRFTAGKHE